MYPAQHDLDQLYGNQQPKPSPKKGSPQPKATAKAKPKATNEPEEGEGGSEPVPDRSGRNEKHPVIGDDFAHTAGRFTRKVAGAAIRGAASKISNRRANRNPIAPTADEGHDWFRFDDDDEVDSSPSPVVPATPHTPPPSFGQGPSVVSPHQFGSSPFTAHPMRGTPPASHAAPEPSSNPWGTPKQEPHEQLRATLQAATNDHPEGLPAHMQQFRHNMLTENLGDSHAFWSGGGHEAPATAGTAGTAHTQANLSQQQFRTPPNPTPGGIGQAHQPEMFTQRGNPTVAAKPPKRA